MKKIQLTFTILTTALIFVSCINIRPKRDCKVTDLSFDDTDFPSGFVVDRISSPVSEYPKESAGRMASYKDKLVFHLVARYRSSKSAEGIFNDKLERSFSEDDLGKTWVTPDGFSYISPIAQQYHMACGNVAGLYQCRMIGQYEEYYVFFFAYISDDGITLEILEDLLQKIDHNMAQCLEAGE